MSASNSKSKSNESKNIKALFSAICLCIIVLGLIVYFSTNTKPTPNAVNEQTTLQVTTDVQHAVTVPEVTEATTKKAKPATTQPTTMEMIDTNTPFKSFYKYPLTDAVSRGYSEELTFDETMGDWRAHCAVDFAGKEGDEIVAINDGLVMDVYTDNMYGIVVVVDHGGTLVVKYCGLKSATVKKGSPVVIGKKIGTLGKVPCESEQEPHLHLEAKYDSKTVNPLNAMGKTE